MEIYENCCKSPRDPFPLSKADELVSDSILSTEQVPVMVIASSGASSFDKMSLLTDSFRPVNESLGADLFEKLLFHNALREYQQEHQRLFKW